MPGWCQPLVPVLVAWSLGIAADRWAFGDAAGAGTVSPVYAGLAGVCLVAWWFTRRRPGWAWIPLLAAFSLACAAYHHMHWHWFSRSDIGAIASDQAVPVCAEIVVTDVPEPLEKPEQDPWELFAGQPGVRFRAHVVALRNGLQWEPATGKVLVYLTTPQATDTNGSATGGLPAEYLPGDRLRVLGRLRRPTPAMNPGAYDLRAHRRGERILAELTIAYPECVTLLERAPFWDPRSILGRCRLQGMRTFRDYLSEANRPLAQALILGFRQEIPEQFENWLLKTGTLHLLAISGLHVGILAGLFHGLFRWMRVPDHLRVFLLILAIVGYTALSGAQPSTVRAAIMFGAFLLGTLFYHSFWSLNALALAGLIILAANPSFLFRVGPQLSFLAASVLVVLGPYLATSESPRLWGGRSIGNSGRYGWVIGLWRKSLWPALVVTVVLWFMSCPLVWYAFHLIAPLGIILTPLVIPPITVALASGFFLLILGPVWDVPAQVAAWVCEGALSVCRWFIEWLGHALPLYTWQPAPPAWWVAGFYLLWILYLLLTGGHTRTLTRCLQAGLVAWLATGSVFLIWPWRPGQVGAELRVSQLSVGHGLATVVETPDGQVWLYDVGSLAGRDRAARAVAGYLWSRGRRHVDGVLLSHPDLDHYNGLGSLLDYMWVRQVVVSSTMFRQVSEREPGIRALRELLRTAGLPVREVQAGESWSWGECRIEVLHPPPDDAALVDNAASMVLLVTYAGRRMLLTGDLEGVGLARLTEKPPVDVDVLVAPHHGSPQSGQEKIVAWSSPEVVIISGGVASLEQLDINDDNGAETDTASLWNGRQVFHTARDGAVTVTFRGKDGRYTVTAFRRFREPR